MYYGLNREEILELIKSDTPLAEDRITYMGDQSCKLIKYVTNHGKNSEHQKKITDFAEWISLKYLRKHIYDSRRVNKDTKSDAYAVGDFA